MLRKFFQRPVARQLTIALFSVLSEVWLSIVVMGWVRWSR
jgi:hypothetical protein